MTGFRYLMFSIVMITASVVAFFGLAWLCTRLNK